MKKKKKKRRKKRHHNPYLFMVTQKLAVKREGRLKKTDTSNQPPL